MKSNSTNTIRVSECVLKGNDNIVTISKNTIDELKNLASNNKLNKSRLLLHNKNDNKLHEMLIVHLSSPPKSFKYNIPHKNINISKSWLVIEGEILIVIFNDEGDILEHYFIGKKSIDQDFMIRLNNSYYHTLIPTTATVVYIESLIGPFAGRNDAPWAPKEDTILGQEYINNICKSLNVF